jgi:hypothetical protein
MNIIERIDKYLDEDELKPETSIDMEYLNSLEFEDTEQLANLLGESRKSQFVANLIGLGILKKEGDKLVAVKKMSKEDAIKELNPGIVKKTVRKVSKVIRNITK